MGRDWHDCGDVPRVHRSGLYALDRWTVAIRTGLGQEFSVELLRFFFLQVYKVLSFFLGSLSQVLFPFNNVSPVVDVVSNGHLLDPCPGVLHRFLGLHYTIGSGLCAARRLIDLWPSIWTGAHGHETGAGERAAALHGLHLVD